MASTELEHDELIEALDLLYSPRLGSCEKCGKKDNLKACSRCHGVVYCDSVHQKDRWGEHKKACTLSASLRSAPGLPRFCFPSPSTMSVIRAEFVSPEQPQEASSVDLESVPRIEFNLSSSGAPQITREEGEEGEGVEGVERLQKLLESKAAMMPPTSMPLAAPDEQLAASLVRGEEVVVASPSMKLTFTVPLAKGPASFECRTGRGAFTRADFVTCVREIYRVLFAAGPVFGVSVHSREDLFLHSAFSTKPNSWTIVTDT